jgi:hypothetical protein
MGTEAGDLRAADGETGALSTRVHSGICRSLTTQVTAAMVRSGSGGTGVRAVRNHRKARRVHTRSGIKWGLLGIGRGRQIRSAASGALGVVPVLSLLDADMIARGVSHDDVAGSPWLGDGLL